jgi:hypothetical protein
LVAEIDSFYIRTRPFKAVDRILSHFFFQGRFLTTKHRWLNSFLLKELQLMKHIPQVKPVEKPIFIIGTGRSGSTILGKILSMHQDIGFLNEPKAIWYVIDPRDDVHGHFQYSPGQYWFTAQDATPQKCQGAKRLFSFYLDVVNSSRVVDKNPEIVYRISYVQAIFPDAKFILLVRNGWDAIFSIAEWSRRSGRKVNNHTEDWWGHDQRKWDLMVAQLVPVEPLLVDHLTEISSFTRYEDMAAVEWVLAMQQGLRERKSHPNSFYTLRYEDLTRNSNSALDDLVEFCELGQDHVFLSYSEKVLSPNQAKPPVDISPIIHNAFMSTMSALNYPTTIQ